MKWLFYTGLNSFSGPWYTGIGQEDRSYVKKNLDRENMRFSQGSISKQEQKHSIRVARDMESECSKEGLELGSR